MPTITDLAVCIRRWDFSETSQTVSLLTREHGIVRGIAKGAKREKGNFSGGFDVLTLGLLVAIVKPGRDLATLTQWDLMNLYRAVRQNLAANRAALYMTDLVHHMLTVSDPHPELFDALTATLEKFGSDARIDVELLRFQWLLLKETGYQPDLRLGKQETRNNARESSPPSVLAAQPSRRVVAFSPEAGGIVEDTGTGDQWRVRWETVELLQRIDSESAGAAAHQSDAAPEIVHRANRLLAAYLCTLIGSEPPSLHWMFPDLKE